MAGRNVGKLFQRICQQSRSHLAPAIQVKEYNYLFTIYIYNVYDIYHLLSLNGRTNGIIFIDESTLWFRLRVRKLMQITQPDGQRGGSSPRHLSFGILKIMPHITMMMMTKNTMMKMNTMRTMRRKARET